jgi:hypothetical protein
MAVLKPTLGRRAISICFALLALLWCSLATNAQTVSKEYQVKAAFLFNFAQFVDWPPAAFTNADMPFTIGILGRDPFGAALEDTVQGETVSNRKIVIERAQTVDGLKNCQVIFVCLSEKNHLPAILSALDARPILTVSEIEGFDQLGGGINFYRDGGKVRFEVNPAAARRDGLKVSSQLLSLGKIIQTSKEGK